MRGGEAMDQADELERRWIAALGAPQPYRWLYKGRWCRALPLPWHTRLRLRCTSLADHAGCWLACHGRYGAAQALWRATGLWHTRTRRGAK